MPPGRPHPAARRAPEVGEAWFAGVRARGAVECVDVGADPGRLDRGYWAVVGDFEGRVRAWRFAEVERPAAHTTPAPQWSGPGADAWRTSLERDPYVERVEEVRQAIRSGDVYQVNLCRVLEAPLPGGGHPTSEPSARALAAVLDRGNPAPYAGGVHVPAGSDVAPVWVVTASPELFLRRTGDLVESGPIKGTAADPSGLTEKDRAENVMIADLVRNDLSRVCRPATVEVVRLLDVEHHPGLVHLVTTVAGRLRPGVGWGDLLAATYPPASVSGAPKLSALEVIRRLEPVPRGPYCGAVGWVDGDAGTAELAVGIRTFWWDAEGGGTLRFGTGAGVTWSSDPAAEWAETELKAARLVALASRPAGRPGAGQSGGGADERSRRTHG